MRKIELIIDQDISERLDYYLSKTIENLSRNRIQKLIKDGHVLVNGHKEKSKYLLKSFDKVIVHIPGAKKPVILPQKIPLDIIYEDEDIAVINKPQGMIVHPASGNFSDTLVNALLYQFENLSNIGGTIRPGIVHRLDKDTSGLLVIAKNNFSHKILSNDFKERNVKREYIALINGVLEDEEGVIDEPIGRNPNDRRKMAVVSKNSKQAITKYKVLDRFENYTLVSAVLETGRTHQIRVHFSYMNHPVVGDPIYSTKNEYKLDGQLLHSIKIGFVHPRSKEYMEFSVDMPERFINILKKLQ